jgi:hypothetical protein
MGGRHLYLITVLRLKLAGFWRGGNSLKLSPPCLSPDAIVQNYSLRTLSARMNSRDWT